MDILRYGFWHCIRGCLSSNATFIALLEYNDINIALALGDKALRLALVAFHSLLQICCFAFMAYFFMMILPAFFGIHLEKYKAISFVLVAKNVAIYLGIPFVLGFVSRAVVMKRKGRQFYESIFLTKLNPLSLIALLYIIIVMFSYKGESLWKLPLDALLVACPLMAYFILMFCISRALSKRFGYESSCAISFSACGNNFELSLAVAIAYFGIHSPQAFASIVGVLIEVPIMLFLVYVFKSFKKFESV